MLELKYEYKDDIGYYYTIKIKRSKLQIWLTDEFINVISYKSI